MANSNNARDENGSKRLDSWGEIAAYIRRDLSTAMRWEKRRGLPVHRVPGGERGTVYAFTHEIDDWMNGNGNAGSEVKHEKSGDRSQETEVRSQQTEVRSSGTEIEGIGEDAGKVPDPPAGIIAKDRPEKDDLAPWMAAVVPHGRRQFYKYMLAAGCVAVAAAVVYGLARPPAIPRILAYHQITNDGLFKEGPIVTDGERIYFPELTPSGWIIAQTSTASAGVVKTLSTFFKHPDIQDLNRTRSQLLILDPLTLTPMPRLWAMPLSGGPPQRVGNIDATAALWTPDGKSILYAVDNELSQCNLDGSESRKIATLPARIGKIRWSPRGKILRLDLTRPNQEAEEIWEAGADGSNAHLLLPGWRISNSQANGEWTPDGKYFVFGSPNGTGWDLYALSERRGILEAGSLPPIKLTSGLLSGRYWVPSENENMAYTVEEGARNQVLRYDRATGQFVPYLVWISAPYVDFSRDGKWIAYTDSTAGALWMSHLDGSQAIRLTHQYESVELPRWSPDGKQIAFMGIKHGDQTWKVYVIPAEGGEDLAVMPSASPQGAPTWSPDGKRIAFGDLREASGKFPKGASIHIVDVTSHEAHTLPGSNGLWTARWSPDGRHVAAMTTNGKTLKVFDFQTSQWNEIASAGSINDLNWSYKGDALYFVDVLPSSDPVIYRARLQDHKVEKVATLTGISPIRSAWLGVTPDDSILISNSVGTSEIYALDMDLP